MRPSNVNNTGMKVTTKGILNTNINLNLISKFWMTLKTDGYCTNCRYRKNLAM